MSSPDERQFHGFGDANTPPRTTQEEDNTVRTISSVPPAVETRRSRKDKAVELRQPPRSGEKSTQRKKKKPVGVVDLAQSKCYLLLSHLTTNILAMILSLDF